MLVRSVLPKIAGMCRYAPTIIDFLHYAFADFFVFGLFGFWDFVYRDVLKVRSLTRNWVTRGAKFEKHLGNSADNKVARGSDSNLLLYFPPVTLTAPPAMAAHQPAASQMLFRNAINVPLKCFVQFDTNTEHVIEVKSLLEVSCSILSILSFYFLKMQKSY